MCTLLVRSINIRTIINHLAVAGLLCALGQATGRYIKDPGRYSLILTRAVFAQIWCEKINLRTIKIIINVEKHQKCHENTQKRV